MNVLQTVLIIGALVCLLFISLLLATLARKKREDDYRELPPASFQKPSANRERPTLNIDPARIQAADTSQTKAEASVDLSNSGAVTIKAEIERCVAAQRWDEAIKWATLAVNTLPESDDLNVGLAEVYAKAGYIDRFTPLLESLEPQLGNNEEQLERLLTIAREVVPDHPLVTARQNPSATPPTIR